MIETTEADMDVRPIVHTRGEPHTLYFQARDWVLLGRLAANTDASRSEVIRRLIRAADGDPELTLRHRIQAVLDGGDDQALVENG